MSGKYSINTAQKLFEKIGRDLESFYNHPSEDGIFNVIFPLYHLREWICPGGYKSNEMKPCTEPTKEERIHDLLYNYDDYKIIRELCNNIKHWNPSKLKNSIDLKTYETQGFICGLASCGESLGTENFLVNGKSIRDVFSSVYKVYNDYFENSIANSKP